MEILDFYKNNVTSGIYCIQNKTNFKLYIGSSKNIYSRWAKHRSLLKYDKHENAYLQNTINKYGIDNFTFVLIETVKESNLTIREQYWIDTLKPSYNITKEVIRNTPSKESSKKISDTLKRKYKEGIIKSKSEIPIEVYDLEGNYIKTYESQRKCAKDLNIHFSNITNILARHYKQCNGFQFKKVNGIRKMSKVDMTVNFPKCKKPNKLAPVDVYDVNGNFISTFISQIECAEKLKISKSSITKVLQGVRLSCKGFIIKRSNKTFTDKEIQENTTSRLLEKSNK